MHFVCLWTRNILFQLEQNRICIWCKSILDCYSYLVFVGNGWLTLVPSSLPHLKKLCLWACYKMVDKYVEELMAAVPDLEVRKSPSNWVIFWGQWETNTWTTIICVAVQAWMLSSGSERCQMGHKTVTVIIWKSQTFALFLCRIMHVTCFFVTLKFCNRKTTTNIVAVYGWERK
jgi:hypothetical protein